MSSGSNRPGACVSGAHDGGIFAVCQLRNGTLLSGGGKDRRIVQWTGQLQRTGNELTVSLTLLS